MCDHSIAGPSNSGKGNALGFSGPVGAGCRKQVCPAYPIHTVNICVLVNLETEVRIQQGCLKCDFYEHEHDHCEDPDDPVTPAPKSQDDITFSAGQTYDSWGRKCRVVSWSRKVTDDAFIRLRFLDVESETSCGYADVNNQLLKFEVDGLDLKPVINRYAGVTGGVSASSYIKAGCAGGGTGPVGCCNYGTTGAYGKPNWNISDIPSGAEIVVGPIRDLPYGLTP